MRRFRCPAGAGGTGRENDFDLKKYPVMNISYKNARRAKNRHFLDAGFPEKTINVPIIFASPIVLFQHPLNRTTRSFLLTRLLETTTMSSQSSSEQQSNMSGHQPLLSLRMKSARASPPSKSEQADVVDRIGIMLRQETTTYACQDYIQRRKCENPQIHSSDDDCPDLVDEHHSTIEVDAICREKMCEWSYRIIDHFHASRDIVAISFAYLDKFVDQCSCDRSAFKLASMTCLYIATKLFNGREISVDSLATLSRGEFDRGHILEMEQIILKTLGWRLHPPTVQCFINALYGVLPSSSTPVTRAIHQRATFFAELALFDYSFVTQPRSLIALAALLNAMEGMDESVVPKAEQKRFVKTLRDSLNIDHPEDLVESIRNRLWYIYSQSLQYQADSEDLAPPEPCSDARHEQDNLVVRKAPSDGELSQSPVSVCVDHH